VSEYRDRANHSTRQAGHTHTVSNPDQEHHHHHGKDEIQSFSHKTQSSVDLHEFEQFLGALPSNIYRAKGFLNSVNRSTGLLFNFTCGRFDFRRFRLTWVRNSPLKPYSLVVTSMTIKMS
jgi:G3E family GTPase